MTPVAILLLLALLALSIPVGAALGLLGLGLIPIFSSMPLWRAMGELAWAASTNVLLVSIPLFVMLGEILLRAGITGRLYEATARWLSWLPGGLMHANIGTSMAFAATCGSSVATAATVGTIAVPMIGQYSYNERLFLGSIAAGGTLGILIPPSINMIIYGWLTETSVPQLYMAGIVPGMVLAALFGLTIVLACVVRPAWAGVSVGASWSERIACLPDLLPPLGLFLVIIGSIYAGWATPTESAALGVVCALLLAASRRRLSFAMLQDALLGTMRTTGIIALFLWGAWFLNFVLATVGFIDEIELMLDTWGVSPLATLLTVVALYLVLGCFIDPLALMIVTVPIVTPPVLAAGYDPVWFGVLIVILMETALVTPPFGVNLFVVHGVRRRGSLDDVMMGIAPFVVTLLLMIALVIVWPELVLWLPRMLG